jgi:hypothetical protein
MDAITPSCAKRAELDSCAIRLQHAVAHGRRRLHFARQQAAILRRVGEGLEEICGARAERAVGEAFHNADSQVCIAKCPANSNFRQGLEIDDRRRT